MRLLSYVVAQPNQPVPTTLQLLFPAPPCLTGSLPPQRALGLRVLTVDRSLPTIPCEKAGHCMMPSTPSKHFSLAPVPAASRRQVTNVAPAKGERRRWLRDHLSRRPRCEHGHIPGECGAFFCDITGELRRSCKRGVCGFRSACPQSAVAATLHVPRRAPRTFHRRLVRLTPAP
jgi:hypothetical protein